MFFSHALLSASAAVIRFSGSNTNILSSRSKAGPGINAKSSLSRLLCCFFGLSVCQCGSFITEGQTAGVGVPQTLEIISSCIISTLAWYNDSSTLAHPKFFFEFSSFHLVDAHFFWNNSVNVMAAYLKQRFLRKQFPQDTSATPHVDRRTVTLFSE